MTVSGFTTIVLTAVMTMLWLRNRRQFDGLHLWAARYAFLSAGFLLVSFRNYIPAVLSIVAANTLLAVASLVLIEGLERFTGTLKSRLYNYILLGLFVGVFSYFTFIKPDVGVRIALISAIVAWYFLQSAFLLFFRVDSRIRAITRGTAIVCTLYAAAQFYRLALTFLIPAPADYMAANMLDTSVQLLNLLLGIALAFALILMVNRRTLQIIREGEEMLVRSKVALEVDRRLREDIDLSRRRLESVLDSMDALVYVSDMDTHEILFLNEFGRRIMGVPVPGGKCYEFLQGGMSAPCPFCTNRRLVDTEGSPSGVIRWELQNTKTGSWYDCRDRAIQWTDGRLVRLEIATDITERKRYEQDLRKSENKFKLMLEMIPAAVFQTSENHTKVDFLSGYFTKLLGYSYDDIPTLEKWFELAYPDEAHRKSMIEKTMEHFRKSLEDSSYSTAIHSNVTCKDGSQKHILFQGLMLGNQWLGCGFDLTELEENRKKLTAYTNRLLTVQEEERRRLARELHDDFTQRLAVFAMELSGLADSVETRNEAFDGKLRHLHDQISAFSKDIHDVSRQLHPSIIEDLGIARAIQSECRNFARRTEIEVNFKTSEIPPGISREVSITLFRIVQEALRNIQKHAGVRKAEVSLEGGDRSINLIVRDAGAGFDPEKTRTGQGLGLISITERAHSVRGTVGIDSAPGMGTRMEIRIPLEGAPDE
jgi:signal transduction histidine kinase